MKTLVRFSEQSDCMVAQKEAALDELVIMCAGLWPTEESSFMREAAEDLERAETPAELRAAFSFWAGLESEGAQDPDDEARAVLLPDFARDADEYASTPVPWFRICWRLPLLPEELLADDRERLAFVQPHVGRFGTEDCRSR